jgi:hypothetical protein
MSDLPIMPMLPMHSTSTWISFCDGVIIPFAFQARLEYPTKMLSPVSSEKSSFEESDRIEGLAPLAPGSTEKRQPSVVNAVSPPDRTRPHTRNPVFKKIHNFIRIGFLLSAAGYYLNTHPGNFLSSPINKGVKGIQEWRHHPYTLPEFYSLCSRDDHGIYTSEAGNEWAQCVTVQNGTIVDVGDFSKSSHQRKSRKALIED